MHELVRTVSAARLLQDRIPPPVLFTTMSANIFDGLPISFLADTRVCVGARMGVINVAKFRNGQLWGKNETISLRRASFGIDQAKACFN